MIIFPKITVVLATYNGEKYIVEQLESILNQSVDFLYEIIIFDDLSIDNTFPILQKYQKKHDNIHLFQNKKRLGVVSNFEKLIKYAEGEYIALCDQDDIWHNNKLKVAIKYLDELQNKNIPLLFHSDLQVVDKDGEVSQQSFFNMRGYSFPSSKAFDIMLGRSGIMGNTMVFNQALKEKILPFPKDLIVHDYWIALVNEFIGRRITSSTVLVKYRMHNSNTSKILRTSTKKRFFRKNIILPYHNIQREKVLEEFRERFTLKNEDLYILNIFLEYLYFKKNKLFLMSLVSKYNFFRLGFRYKLKLYGAIVWKT